MQASTKSYIYLGAFLDQLFNNECTLDRIGDDSEEAPGAFLLPPKKSTISSIFPSDSEYEPGTGNIVILGEPGTGKTSLALHIAAMCALRKENAEKHVAFVSFEEHFAKLKTKAKGFGRDICLQQMFSLQNVISPPSDETLARWLNLSIDDALQRIEGEFLDRNMYSDWDKFYMEKRRPILVPSLSPRGEEDERNGVFWERYNQLHAILTGAEYLREHPEISRGERRDLRIVCIDSLSVFGKQLLSREEILRIFELFTQKGVIGIFVADDRSRYTGSSNEQYMETIDNLADVVVQLKSEYRNNYYRRTIEISKSRYVHNLIGRHIFKIAGKSSFQDTDTLRLRTQLHRSIRNNTGVLPILSVDYLLSQQPPVVSKGTNSESLKQRYKMIPDQRILFGQEPLCTALPPNYKHDWVITLEGPRLTFKSAIGIDYLLSGILPKFRDHVENALIIRLHDLPFFSTEIPFYGQTRISYHFAKRWLHGSSTPLTTHFRNPHLARGFWQGINRDETYDVRSVQTLGDLTNDNGAGGIIELNIKSGKILPEEVLMYVWEVLFFAEKNGTPITRVFLDDISRIAISYPAIHANDSFLPALARMLRERNIGLLIAGTTDEHTLCDEVINRAKNISNSVLSSRLCEIYGESIVTLTGEGRNTGPSKPSLAHLESVPVTIRPPENFKDPTGKDIAFIADEKQLSGLIGFHGTNKKIIRPGITFYIFEEGERQKKYNDLLDYKLQMTFGKPYRNGMSGNMLSPRPLRGSHAGGHVELIRFDSTFAPETFDASDQQYRFGRPHDRTIISVIDEYTTECTQNRFAPIFTDENGSRTSIRPYYKNVLLLALNGDILESTSPSSWSDLAKLNGLLFTDNAKETIICSFFDSLYVSGFKPGEIILSDYGEFIDYLEKFCQSENTKKEIHAMVKTYRKSREWRQHSRMHDESAKNNSSTAISTGWIGWYTEIVDYVETRRGSSHELKVFSLPGNGFQGDWSLGVLKGSASLQLGKEAVNLICSKKEQNRRYFSGVGLPSYIDERNGIPQVTQTFNVTETCADLDLSKILSIHKEAHKRSSFPNYVEMRVFVYHLIQDLAKISKEEDYNGPKFAERLKQFIEQLKFLTKENELQ